VLRELRFRREVRHEMRDALQLRDASPDDLPGVLAIYNEVLASSTAIFSHQPATLEERWGWWQARIAQGYPVLVARDALGVAGFASFGDFRSGPGYRFAVEHTVHVRADGRGRGVGTHLMRALFARAASLDKHVMVAGVDAGNAASIRFHERLGFTRTGCLREVGYKFDRWLDLVFLQRMI
jgi:L-amino acid N-acyltransferase